MVRSRMIALLAILCVVGLPLIAQQPEGDDRSWEEKWTTDPAKEDPEWRAAVEHRMRGEVDAAVDLYLKFLEANPREISVLVSMGSAMAEKGDLIEAERWWRRALEVVPGQVYARLYLARLLFHQGRWKEAAPLFEVLAKNAATVPNVRASAKCNLGKIALIHRRFSRADRWFRSVLEEPTSPKGKISLASKGRTVVRRYRPTRMWLTEKSQSMTFYFHPEILKAKEEPARKAWVAEREKQWQRMCGLLGISFPESVPVYVFNDEEAAFQVTGRDRIATLKYSWWEVTTGWDRHPAYDLAHALAARKFESRPGSFTMVEGLSCWLAQDASDPHAAARKQLRDRDFPHMPGNPGDGRTALAALHANQRRPLTDFTAIGRSFVHEMIERYGLEKFLVSYGSYNNVMLYPRHIDQQTKLRDWPATLSEVFRRGLGIDYATAESQWLSRIGAR